MTEQALERLIYNSQATQDFPSLSSISAILAISDQNNRRDNVTGALVLADGAFLQVLEGGGLDIQRTLERLLNDPRHTDLKVLNRQPIDFRDFKDWGMIGAASRPTRQIVMNELIAFAEADPAYVIDRVRTLVANQGGY
nr:BLUF domain-containing protein [uncultured Brevundimonas sp.]